MNMTILGDANPWISRGYLLIVQEPNVFRKWQYFPIHIYQYFTFDDVVEKHAGVWGKCLEKYRFEPLTMNPWLNPHGPNLLVRLSIKLEIIYEIMVSRLSQRHNPNSYLGFRSMDARYTFNWQNPRIHWWVNFHRARGTIQALDLAGHSMNWCIQLNPFNKYLR